MNVRFFNKITTVSEPNYLPSDEDILRARLRTTGIVERVFVMDKMAFRFIDVGGQRNERRKWIHCFEGVSAVLFVAAINEYDEFLMEDPTQNRLVESLTIFEQVCENPFFKGVDIILFLNKRDLFEQKLKYSSLNTHFPNYQGGKDCQLAQDFIKQQFLHFSKLDETRQIFPHFTVATDTENIEKIWKNCRESIVRQNLSTMGMV